MAIYDFDTKEFIKNNIPPNKRLSNILNLVYSLLSALKYNIDAYSIYRNTPNYNVYDDLATYGIGEIIVFNGFIYQSLVGANTGNSPDISPSFWQSLGTITIGSDIRMQYKPNKLAFEFALNQRFGTTFRQPDLVSDIYIKNTAFFNPTFVIGGTEANSSIVFLDRSSQFIINQYFVQPAYSFTIFVPIALYTAVGEAAISSFANSLTAIGKSFIIQTY